MSDSIYIGSDHAGFTLKEGLKKYLVRKGFHVTDAGTFSKDRCDYPLFAAAVAKAVSQHTVKRGVIICKTGIGSSIVANRFPGVRASLCYNVRAARLTREHNDSNVLVLGSAFVNRSLGLRITDAWLRTKFAGGRHQRRLSQIKKIERAIGCVKL